jgi:hypothetical protein
LPAVLAAKVECLPIALSTQRSRFVHRHAANGVFGHSSGLRGFLTSFRLHCSLATPAGVQLCSNCCAGIGPASTRVGWLAAQAYSRGRRLILLFASFLNLLEVLGGLLLEVLQAIYAAEFDFLSFVREYVGFAFVAKLIVADDALVEGIRLGVVHFVLVSRADAQNSGNAGGDQYSSEQ